MEIKISAEKDPLDYTRVIVKAEYFKGDEKVYEMNTAFPSTATEKEIREEIKKAGDLFESEEKQKKKQKKVDEVQASVDNLVSKLND